MFSLASISGNICSFPSAVSRASWAFDVSAAALEVISLPSWIFSEAGLLFSSTIAVGCLLAVVEILSLRHRKEDTPGVKIPKFLSFRLLVSSPTETITEASCSALTHADWLLGGWVYPLGVKLTHSRYPCLMPLQELASQPF